MTTVDRECPQGGKEREVGFQQGLCLTAGGHRGLVETPPQTARRGHGRKKVTEVGSKRRLSRGCGKPALAIFSILMQEGEALLPTR